MSSNQQQQQRRLNPFEVAHLDDDWDDWSDEEGDDNLEEQRGLVNQEYGRIPGRGFGRGNAEKNYSPNYANSNRSSSAFPVNTQRGFKYYMYIVLGFLVLVFVILFGRSPNKGENYQSLNDLPDDNVDSNDNTAIHNLVVLGERHSGSTWIYTKLQECFPDAPVVTATLQRIGYFFQDDSSSQEHSSVVVHVTIDPYNWFESMRLRPLYMPRHHGPAKSNDKNENSFKPLPWETFLKTPWALEERPERDLPYADRTDRVCQLEYEYNRVMSCIEGEGEENPIYELQPDGTPYPSIVEFRAAKIRNHQSVIDWPTVHKVFSIQYQDITKDNFAKLVLKPIEHATGWENHCSSESMESPPSLQQTYSMNVEFVEYVTKHVDWEVEEQFGYKKWGEVEIDLYGIWPEAELSTRPSFPANTDTINPTSAPTQAVVPSPSPTVDSKNDDGKTNDDNMDNGGDQNNSQTANPTSAPTQSATTPQSGGDKGADHDKKPSKDGEKDDGKHVKSGDTNTPTQAPSRASKNPTLEPTTSSHKKSDTKEEGKPNKATASTTFAPTVSPTLQNVATTSSPTISPTRSGKHNANNGGEGK